jgi:hypothetical protein
MLEAVKLPALVSSLDTGLTQMNRDAFWHGKERKGECEPVGDKSDGPPPSNQQAGVVVTYSEVQVLQETGQRRHQRNGRDRLPM